ncbi:MAG: hypothetical protein R3F48_15210 [Candidatus Zixiibacteriota bacterium]
MKLGTGKRQILSLLLLICNALLIVFILWRVGDEATVAPGQADTPEFTIEVLPRVEHFYPDTLSFRRVSPEPLESLVSVYSSDKEIDSIIIKTEILPGEWTRYDSLLILLDVDSNQACSICVRIGSEGMEADNENERSCIEIERQQTGGIVLMASLNDYKKRFKRLPLGKPIGIYFYDCGVRSILLKDIRVIRHEN